MNVADDEDVEEFKNGHENGSDSLRAFPGRRQFGRGRGKQGIRAIDVLRSREGEKSAAKVKILVLVFFFFYEKIEFFGGENCSGGGRGRGIILKIFFS